jgi:hypothetical protein
MDSKIAQYQAIILDVLQEYAAVRYANIEGENEIISDTVNNRYQLVTIGWQGYKRIHACTLHLDIRDDKIWIQSDQTEHGIANNLMERGVHKSDIVLAYQPLRIQRDLGFALA